jgi:hypothetical protein
MFQRAIRVREAAIEIRDDKRAYDRQFNSLPIKFSHFNSQGYHEAQVLNHCAGGMCFKSICFLKPGTTVLIKVKSFRPNGACTGICQELRSIALAEVKWCHEVPDARSCLYRIGVQYYESEY